MVSITFKIIHRFQRQRPWADASVLSFTLKARDNASFPSRKREIQANTIGVRSVVVVRIAIVVHIGEVRRRNHN